MGAGAEHPRDLRRAPPRLLRPRPLSERLPPPPLAQAANGALEPPPPLWQTDGDGRRLSEGQARKMEERRLQEEDDAYYKKMVAERKAKKGYRPMWDVAMSTGPGDRDEV